VTEPMVNVFVRCFHDTLSFVNAIPCVFGVAVVMTSALRCRAPPIDILSVSADPCPGSELVFARGTNEHRELHRLREAMLAL
jgi:hypothetical protein